MHRSYNDPELRERAFLTIRFITTVPLFRSLRRPPLQLLLLLPFGACSESRDVFAVQNAWPAPRCRVDGTRESTGRSRGVHHAGSSNVRQSLLPATLCRVLFCSCSTHAWMQIILPVQQSVLLLLLLACTSVSIWYFCTYFELVFFGNRHHDGWLGLAVCSPSKTGLRAKCCVDFYRPEGNR